MYAGHAAMLMHLLSVSKPLLDATLPTRSQRLAQQREQWMALLTQAWQHEERARLLRSRG